MGALRANPLNGVSRWELWAAGTPGNWLSASVECGGTGQKSGGEIRHTLPCK